MDNHFIKQLFIGFILVVTIGCIIYQSLGICGCWERCYRNNQRNNPGNNQNNRKIVVKQALEIP
tara:strand:+ start:9117 stop:9308 length:192 start_codon:yes stop_codon:yes gene_type:complete